MGKLLEEMQALAGVAERNMWETKITLPDREMKSGNGNQSGTPRSDGTGTGNDYEEPEPDGEFETDDDEDKKATKKAKKKYKADKEKEDEEEDPNEPEPDNDEDDANMKEDATQDAIMVSKMGELLKGYGMKIEFGKNITISGKPTYQVKDVLKKYNFRFHKNPPWWEHKGLDLKSGSMFSFYRDLLKKLQKTGMKESLLGGAVPGSDFPEVRVEDPCCDSCAKTGKKCKKKVSIKAKMESILEGLTPLTPMEKTALYPPIPGMEGPYAAKNGWVLYYDPRVNAYWHPDDKRYLPKGEADQLVK